MHLQQTGLRIDALLDLVPAAPGRRRGHGVGAREQNARQLCPVIGAARMIR